MTLSPTITPGAACSRNWDVIVIGAGPAGAVAALEGANAGLAVLLLERKAFPRDKVCGACLNGRALGALSRLGLGRRLSLLEGTVTRRLQIRCGSRRLTLPLPEGLAVSRGRLDGALVAASIEAGAQFLPEMAASVGPVVQEGTAEFRSVELRDAQGRQQTVRGRVVLAADGLGHPSLDRLPEFASQVSRSSRIGLGCLIDQVPGDLETGSIQMALGRAGYVGMVRVESPWVNIAAAVDPEFVRASRSPARAVAAILKEAGIAAIPALEEARWQGTPPLTRRSARLAGRRILLLGDSAGYVEPFTGEGMAWAIAAAAEVIPLARSGLTGWDTRLEANWSSTMRRLVTRKQFWCRWLSAALRSQILTRSLLSAVACVPQLVRPIVASLNSAQPVAEGSGR